MSAWGKLDQANNAPKWDNIVAGRGAYNATGPANATAMFANVTPGEFLSNAAVGIYGVDTADMPSYNGKITNPGWVVTTRFTGPVTGFTIANGGTAYANTDTVTVSNGTANATGTLTTNSTGGITSVTITNSGGGFINSTAAHVAITTSTGSNGSLTVVLGGRAGRVQHETLVAMGSISGNTYLP